MAITEIKYGSLASSKELNDNFNALNKDIQDLATNLSTTNANMATSMSTLNKNVANQISEVNESLTNTKNTFKDEITALKENIEKIDYPAKIAPNYSKARGFSFPYTVTETGWAYVGLDGSDWRRYAYVNGSRVTGSCGYSGGYSVYDGGMIFVSKGDVITSNASSDGTFYPLKGV